MSYRLLYSKRADKQLAKMDRGTARVIVAWLNKNIDGAQDPRARGKALRGDLSGAWRYRIGDYRVLCDIHDEELIVLAIEIGHRSMIYRR
ncbi:addiction module toxin, RelE/StbE family [Actinomyces sp. Chiba101]|uniref:mRNA interferase RelE/StbE n=1 Tax=Actinomyces denticolens TaxID=52767 RepID=A0ABY1I166_9ACTO|nr:MULTISPECIES: type II toxin-antitoxin system RelE/ParE family toxin [Actinomyces]BAW93696.1 addiction module toxin, RelE/StbE family [Actinomyces sp. Chiba101]GAV93448.1 addiction module toxin, RelE/StbE family [Actinomyces denticolens]SHI31080.1 mRNA interferase RelE/StbE [Actinomyces denticolens]SUU74651.1 Toxin RelG [Actinomyces denticolens]